jgi:hypothetical protein
MDFLRFFTMAEHFVSNFAARLADARGAAIIGASSWPAACDIDSRLPDLIAWSRFMAKKKKAVKKSSPAPRIPRKEQYSKDRVLAVVGRVKEQTSRLSSLAASMDSAEVGSVKIDGHAMLIRGLNQIDNFIDNAQRAVREAKVAKSGL